MKLQDWMRENLITHSEMAKMLRISVNTLYVLMSGNGFTTIKRAKLIERVTKGEVDGVQYVRPSGVVSKGHKCPCCGQMVVK